LTRSTELSTVVVVSAVCREVRVARALRVGLTSEVYVERVVRSERVVVRSEGADDVLSSLNLRVVVVLRVVVSSCVRD
jgi:hypothetical protein